MGSQCHVAHVLAVRKHPCLFWPPCRENANEQLDSCPRSFQDTKFDYIGLLMAHIQESASDTDFFRSSRKRKDVSWQCLWHLTSQAFSAYFSFGVIIHLAAKNRALWPGQRGNRMRTMRHSCCQIQRLSGCAKTVPQGQFTRGSSPCQACNSTEPKMPVRLLKRSVTYQPSTAVLKRPSSSWGEPKMLLKRWQLCISRQARCTCHVTLYYQRDCFEGFEASKHRVGYLAGNCINELKTVCTWQEQIWRSLGLLEGSSLPSWCD